MLIIILLHKPTTVTNITKVMTPVKDTGVGYSPSLSIIILLLINFLTLLYIHVDLAMLAETLVV